MKTATLPDLLHNTDALFLSNAININYLTGFSGLSHAEREAFLLITKHQWYLFTFPLYKDEAEVAAKNLPHISLQFITPEHSLSTLLTTIQTHEQLRRLAFEPQSLTYQEYSTVARALPQVLLTPDVHQVEQLRIIKTHDEMIKLKKATALTDECFVFIQTLVQKGISEAELAWRIERFFREHRAELSFDPIVAFNEHSAIPHHVPSSTTNLSSPTTILMDFGAKVDGYHADMTRVICYGAPNKEWETVYNTVKKAEDEALTYLSNTANPSGAKADELARLVITNAGFPIYPHSLGHGTGLEIHEDPRLSIHRDQELLNGMVFSVEPGIYLTGKFGIRIEDLVMKTTNGIELLSNASKEIIVIPE